MFRVRDPVETVARCLLPLLDHVFILRDLSSGPSVVPKWGCSLQRCARGVAEDDFSFREVGIWADLRDQI
jgi:hypothetical protein